jgi:hypothetical protein
MAFLVLSSVTIVIAAGTLFRRLDAAGDRRLHRRSRT